MPCAMPNAKAEGEVRRPIAGKWMRSCRPSAKVAENKDEDKNRNGNENKDEDENAIVNEDDNREKQK
jgi:hypothetical protein